MLRETSLYLLDHVADTRLFISQLILPVRLGKNLASHLGCRQALVLGLAFLSISLGLLLVAFYLLRSLDLSTQGACVLRIFGILVVGCPFRLGWR